MVVGEEVREGVGTTETPDLDDIHDMEEDDLEGGMMRLRLLRLKCRLYLLLGCLMLGMLLGLLEIKKSADDFFVVLTWKSQRAISFKSAHTMLKLHTTSITRPHEFG